MSTQVQWRRRIVLALIALAILSALAYGFRTQPVAVDTAMAVRQPLRVTVEQEGKTRVVDRYVVSAPVAGYMRRIQFDVGDTVRQGQTLIGLEPRRAEVLDVRRRAQAQAQVAAAQANLGAARQRVQAAEADAGLAQTELLRVRALRAGRHVSQDEEDRATATNQRAAAELRSEQFAVEVARHELEATRTALQYAAAASADGALEPVTVRASVTGRVLKIPRKSEGAVEMGQPLVEVGDPHALEVEIDVLSADAVRIRAGTRVLFERWGGSAPLEGVVRIVEPTGFTKVSALGVEEQRVWVIADLVSPPAQWEHLGDGYRVEASFILWEGKDVLQIPASALFRDGAGWAVFTVRQGKAIKRAVRIGQRNGLRAQILDGLGEGEQVIVHPDDQVRDGVKVEAR